MCTALILLFLLAFSPGLTLQPNIVEDRLDDPPSVETVAGTGFHGALDGEHARFNMPAGVFGSLSGDIFIADTFNNLIRATDEEGYTRLVAGTLLESDVFDFPSGGFRDSEEALFNRPGDGVLCPDGRIFVADSMNHAIRMIEHGTVTTFAGGEGPGHSDGTLNEARFYRPGAITGDEFGNIFVADTLNHVIRRIDPAGNVTTIAGIPGVYGHSDGPAGDAIFNAPGGIAVSRTGAIYVADTDNHLIRVIYEGYVTTLAGTLVFAEGEASEPVGGFADGFESMFNLPFGLAVWGDILIVADSANHRIRAVFPNREVITLAGNGYPGHVDGHVWNAEFHFPKGIFVRGNRLYVADTWNNVIRSFRLLIYMV